VKKAAVAIPLIALLVGAILFWWHSGTRAPRVRTAGPDAPPASVSTPPEAPVVPAPPSPEVAPTGSLRVLVTSAASPFAGASVVVQLDGSDQLRKFQSPEGGAQLIQNMPPGAYVVGVRHPKHLPAEARAQVLAGQTAEVRIELLKGGRIFGLVTDPSGAPLPKTNILLLNGRTRTPLGPSMGADTDAQGRYELPAVPHGEYGLRFRHERFKVSDRMGFTFLQGTESYEVNVTLEAGARVTGRVLDEKGSPIEGARIMIGNFGGGGVTQSDRNGEFGLYGLTNDPVNASVSAKGHGTVIRRGILPNTEGMEFRLPRPGTLVGRVEGPEIPEHFVVVLSRHEDDLNQVLRVDTRYFTNAPGGIFVIEDLSPAPYWVEVQAQGYESIDKPQVVVEAGKVTAEVRLKFLKK
jgi:hypothetical protein